MAAKRALPGAGIQYAKAFLNKRSARVSAKSRSGIAVKRIVGFGTTK
jgi:hypothetical protein